MLKRLVCVVALLASTFPALAGIWGEDGHRIVGWIAYQRLTPTAKAEIDRLLTTESTSLPEAAYWPDAVARKQATYRFANVLHYANVPKGSATYDPTRDRPAAGDVVSAIERYAAVLGDANKTDVERLEALRFLAHFVGDIHQPLDVGYKEDKGGNDIEVRFYNRRMKLHAVWDTGILDRAGNSWEDFASQLDGMIRPQDVLSYTEHMEPLDWAQESYSLAVREVYEGVQANAILARPYVDEKLPVVEDQLSIAGVRLAELINGMFPEPATAPATPAQPVEATFVYVTGSGKKYHTAGCRYLQASHSQLALQAAKEKGLEPCKVCDPAR